MGSNRLRNLGRLVRAINDAQQSLSILVNRKLAPIGLNMSRLSVLACFSGQPNKGRNITSIVNDVGLNQPTVTKIVSYLIEQAWLTSQPDSADGRKKILKITPAGLGVVIQAYAEITPAIDQLFARLSDEEIIQLDQLLRKH